MVKQNKNKMKTELKNNWIRFQDAQASNSNLPFSLDLILELINKFYEEEFTKISGNTILLQIRMENADGMTKSLTKFSKINFSDLDKYSKSVAVWYNFKNSRYVSITSNSLYIIYKVLEKESTYITLYEEPKTSQYETPNFALMKCSDLLKDLKIPLTLDLWNWDIKIKFNHFFI